MTVEIRTFTLTDTDAVVALWQETGLTRPWNNPHQDISRKLRVQPELFLVAADGDEIVGSVMAGYDGHRGWLYYLGSSPSRRGEGIARRLVERAEELLIELGCPKVQLMVRPENNVAKGFYDAIGYETFETWATGKRLIAD
ncbi:GNAT family acetyltransferase [Microbacterium aoyamense]|uniref:GNAT family acetyltransferase n=1 Tax=Microbacterium aoyamense TaxID=344166 RepID=A0ABP5B6R5_9MICO|nr:GNAT family acetyltransferase [Microbacterium aoyamense]